jgi:hypothetical protein
MALWREEAEHAAGSDDIPAFMNRTREKKPSLLLFIDPASASATFCLDRILFQPNHPLIPALLQASRSRFRWTKRLGYVTAFIFPTLGLIYYVYQEQVPISGRWRFNFLPKSTSQSTSSDWAPLLEELEIFTHTDSTQRSSSDYFRQCSASKTFAGFRAGTFGLENSSR